MNPFYTAIAQRANHRCEYCKAPEVVFNFPFEVEHRTASESVAASERREQVGSVAKVICVP